MNQLQELARHALRSVATHLAVTLAILVAILFVAVAIAIVRRKRFIEALFDLIPSERSLNRVIYAAVGAVILVFLVLLAINNR